MKGRKMPSYIGKTENEYLKRKIKEAEGKLFPLIRTENFLIKTENLYLRQRVKELEDMLLKLGAIEENL